MRIPRGPGALATSPRGDLRPIETGLRRLAAGSLYLFLLLLPFCALWPVANPFPAVFADEAASTLAVVPANLGAAALLAGGLLSWRSFRYAPAARFLPPLLALLALGLLTAPLALLPTLAWFTALSWAASLAVYLVLTQTAVPPERLVAVLLAGLVVQSLVGLAQFALGRPLGLPGELPLGPGHPLAPLVTAPDGQTWLRAYGLTVNPNALGGFLAVGILLALPLLRNPWARVAWWLLWAGVLATMSRSAWLALLVAAPVAIGWLAYRRPELRAALRSAALGLGVFALLGALALAGPILVRLDPQASPVERGSIDSRVSTARLALGAIAERPLAGVGAGNFPLLMAAGGQGGVLSHAHNAVLQLAAEVGVLGGAIWLWIWLVPALWLWRGRHALSPWAVAAGTAWLAMGLINLFDAYFWVLDAGRLMTMLVLALLSRSLAGVAERAPDAEGTSS